MIAEGQVNTTNFGEAIIENMLAEQESLMKQAASMTIKDEAEVLQSRKSKLKKKSQSRQELYKTI